MNSPSHKLPELPERPRCELCERGLLDEELKPYESFPHIPPRCIDCVHLYGWSKGGRPLPTPIPLQEPPRREDDGDLLGGCLTVAVTLFAIAGVSGTIWAFWRAALQ